MTVARFASWWVCFLFVLSAAGRPGFSAPTTGEANNTFRLLGTLPFSCTIDTGPESTWSIGGETLDRDFAVYDNYKNYLSSLGAKGIRLQAGWAKCNPRPNVYKWQWLDKIIDHALSQNIQPWLELSYGNTNYPGGGGTGLGGGLPKSPEALQAWDQWVQALVGRYCTRVKEYEVWNEPDLGKDAPAEAYADFYIRTAEIIRARQSWAKIYALALAGNMGYAEKFLARMKEKEKLGLIDAVTIHGYPKHPDDTSNVVKMRALLAKYGSKAIVIQGETGAPSTSNTFGALKGHPWTELTQAKWNLRRMLAHHALEVPFNLFTVMELQYPTGLNTKGLLKANPDKTVAYPKPAYRAAQNVFATFDDKLAVIPRYAYSSTTTKKLAVNGYRHKETGRQVVTIWLSGQVPSDSNTTTPVDFVFPQGDFDEPWYVDLRTGQVYAIPEENWSQKGNTFTFKQIPVYDSPIIIGDESVLPPVIPPYVPPEPEITNAPCADGYRGIWFTLGQFSKHGDKYSGGLGTYTANHTPMAVYSRQADKTFFTYGGTLKDKRHLLIMASYYDHKTGLVPRPVIVHDKNGIDDPHDNGSINIDHWGHIWIFVSGRGRARPGYKYRSREPFSIEAFERVSEEEMTYPQPWCLPDRWLHLFTKYTAGRELYWETSLGENWTADKKLAGFGGHYQVSGAQRGKVASFFNYHPKGNVDKRTNLYYVQTEDSGLNWTTVDYKLLKLPLNEVQNPALVIDYESRGTLTYTCDLNFDAADHPLLLYVTGRGHQPGPESGPREFRLTHWDGQAWQTTTIAPTDHNYDMGSLWVNGTELKVIAPTLPGPQPHGSGGEMVLWKSTDQGRTWQQSQITRGSAFNHNYARRPLNARDPFFAFWADGNPDKFSPSRLYFCDSTGERVWQLPEEMSGETARPLPVKPGQ